MRRSGFYVWRMIELAAAIAAAVVLVVAPRSNTAWASDGKGPDPLYMLSYFSNAHVTGAPDATLRLVNDGLLSDHSPDGDLCAAIYVFDANEELNECCSCRITPNGLLTLSVNALSSNTVTHKTPSRGVIKILSSVPPPTPPSGPIPVCDPTSLVIDPGIHGWITHIQRAGATFPQTEEELTNASLNLVPLGGSIGSLEAIDLAEDCKVAIELGSGQGVCSCADAGR